MCRVLALIFLLTTPILRAEVQPPKTPFNDYLVAPLRVHRLVTPGELNLTTTLEEKDLHRIFKKVNRIWGHAGVHFALESILTEPAANPNAYRQNYKSRQLRWLLAIRPKNSLKDDCFHIYYIKRFLANGVYIGRDGMFVKDMARLRTVEGGVSEPIPRVTAHELGHALSLRHRQAVTNLLASGTSGWTFNEAEIKQARDAAKEMKWIRTAPEILREADALYKKGDKKKAAALYRQLATLPLRCPETARAALRTKED